MTEMVYLADIHRHRHQYQSMDDSGWYALQVVAMYKAYECSFSFF